MKTTLGRCVGVALTGVLWLSAPAWSEDEADEGPRIGLALSGGGALGTAHVGVLKVLEELHIPVHFVAGTSMGAIVGGLYASGISPAEMEQILSEVDWRVLLNDRPDRRQMPYRQKVDDLTYLSHFEIGFNHGSFQLPSGLITGQQLDFALQTMALRTAGIDDFDQLPIPFRAVATDIATGEMVVLGHGDAGRAMRASMSIPAIFSPVEIDGRLLVDGSFTNNMPVDVVRAMGADIVIAVDVGQPAPEKAELFSLGKVTGQVLGLQIKKNVREQAALADILVEPDVDEFSATDFERALEMIPRGEIAARDAADTLGPLSVSEAQFSSHIDQVRRMIPLPDTISSVQLTGASSVDSQYVFDKVKTRPGDPFDLEAIRLDLRRLYQTGDYEKVNFFLTEDNDEYTLQIEAIEKPWGPNYLRFGVNLFADFEGESAFDLLASYTATNLNRLRADLKIKVQLGEHPVVHGEFYQPLTRSQTWFVSPWIEQVASTVYIPVDETLLARYGSSMLQGGVDLGLQLGRFGELRVGLARGSGTATLKGGSDIGKAEPPLSEFDTGYGGFRFAAILDQFDNMNFPRHGYVAVFSYFAGRDSLGSKEDFDQLTMFFGGALSHGRHTLLTLVNLYSSLDSPAPTLQSLGGLFKLSGYEPGSITGYDGGSASLLYLYRLTQLPPGFGDGIYIGASVEAGNLWLDRDQVSGSDLLYSGSIFVGVDTALGPLYLAQGFTEDGVGAMYFFVGRSF